MSVADEDKPTVDDHTVQNLRITTGPYASMSCSELPRLRMCPASYSMDKYVTLRFGDKTPAGSDAIDVRAAMAGTNAHAEMYYTVMNRPILWADFPAHLRGTARSADSWQVQTACKELADFIDGTAEPTRVIAELRLGLPFIEGTPDLLLYWQDERKVCLIDYKMGWATDLPRGWENDQLRGYAVLAWSDYCSQFIEPPKALETVLLSPSADTPITIGVFNDDAIGRAAVGFMELSHKLFLLARYPTVDELLPEDFGPSQSACRWCPARGFCGHAARHYEIICNEVTNYAESVVHSLSNESLGMFYEKCKQVATIEGSIGEEIRTRLESDPEAALEIGYVLGSASTSYTAKGENVGKLLGALEAVDPDAAAAAMPSVALSRTAVIDAVGREMGLSKKKAEAFVMDHFAGLFDGSERRGSLRKVREK